MELAVNERSHETAGHGRNMPEMMQLKKSNSVKHAKQAKKKQEKKSYPAIVIEIDDAW